jgi:5,8-dihydroxy-2-naphthoate synthase
MPTFRLAHSPDSDDAFMFWALAAEKLDTEDRRYVHELSDIESLNRRALAGELEITAVSVHAYAHIAETYALLPHGASIGDRYGPRVVARSEKPGDVRGALRGRRIAIPGELTTAYLTLRLYLADFDPVVYPFDEIEDAVERGKVDAGLLIHEGQLTYGQRGLHLWLDLGEWWFTHSGGLPLPLGCNVVRRDLGESLMRGISRDLRSSILYGLSHRREALAYASQFARGLDESAVDEFVGMYVNDYTVDYGEKGRRAVQVLLTQARDAHLIPSPVDVTFVDDGSPKDQRSDAFTPGRSLSGD